MSITDARVLETGIGGYLLESGGYRSVEGAGGGASVISVVAATASGIGPDTNTVNKPAGGATGDYYVLWFQVGDWTTPPTVTCSGFTVEASGMRGITNQHAIYMWKAYSGSEGSTFTVSPSAGGHWSGLICYLVRGAPVGWTPVTPAPVGSTSSGNIVLPAQAVASNDLLLVCYKDYNGRPTTRPAGWTEDAYNASMSGFSQQYASAGTAGPFTITPTGAAAFNLASPLYALSVPALYNDNFDRANGALAAPWVTFEGNHSIASNKVGVGASSPNVSYYDQTFANDQWAEADLVGLTPGLTTISVCVRVNGGDFYYVWVDGGAAVPVLYKRVGGTYTQLGGPGALNVNSKLRLEVQGTTLRVYVNGVLDFTRTDSAIATGKPGIISANGAGATLDNWRGGNLPYVPPVYSDTFDRADTTAVGSGGAGLGANWGGSNGWVVASNRAHKSGGGDYTTFTQDVGSADMWVEAQVNPNLGFGVVNLRHPNGTDQADAYLGFWNPAGFYVIGKSTSGVYNDIATGTSASGVTAVKLRLEAEGSTSPVALRLYANDVLVVNTTDVSSLHTGRYAGINSGAEPTYDWFRCGPLPYTP